MLRAVLILPWWFIGMEDSNGAEFRARWLSSQRQATRAEGAYRYQDSAGGLWGKYERRFEESWKRNDLTTEAWVRVALLLSSAGS